MLRFSEKTLKSALFKSALLLLIAYFSQVYPHFHLHHNHGDSVFSFSVSSHPIDIEIEHETHGHHHDDDHSEKSQPHHKFEKYINWHIIRGEALSAVPVTGEYAVVESNIAEPDYHYLYHKSVYILPSTYQPAFDSFSLRGPPSFS